MEHALGVKLSPETIQRDSDPVRLVAYPWLCKHPKESRSQSSKQSIVSSAVVSPTSNSPKSVQRWTDVGLTSDWPNCSQTSKSDEAKWSKLTRIAPVGSFFGGNTHDLEKIRWGNRLVCLCSSYGYASDICRRIGLFKMFSRWILHIFTALIPKSEQGHKFM